MNTEQLSLFNCLKEIGIQHKVAKQFSIDNGNSPAECLELIYHAKMSPISEHTLDDDNILFLHEAWSKICLVLSYMDLNSLNTFGQLSANQIREIREEIERGVIPKPDLWEWYETFCVDIIDVRLRTDSSWVALGPYSDMLGRDCRVSSMVPAMSAIQLSRELGINDIKSLMEKRALLQNYNGAVQKNIVRQIFNVSSGLGNDPNNPIERGLNGKEYLKDDGVRFLSHFSLTADEIENVYQTMGMNFSYYNFVKYIEDFSQNSFGIATDMHDDLGNCIHCLESSERLMADRIKDFDFENDW